MKTITLTGLLLAAAALLACGPKEVTPLMAAQDKDKPAAPAPQDKDKKPDEKKTETITLGGGCFWCVEAVFQEVKGVTAVESGYTGGKTENPTYKDICTGTTGHAEVCQIKFDPSVITFTEILEVFFKTHDPTTLNRQGNDRGTQYRSAIFYSTKEQKETAEKIKKELDASGAFKDPIVTEITALGKYYKAEDYHQNYFRLNPGQGYCAFVIAPKMDKFRKVFKDKLNK
jgi:peptide-methionine (S)-S-oxide reductase